jgi:hypothetical protein
MDDAPQVAAGYGQKGLQPRTPISGTAEKDILTDLRLLAGGP